MDHAVYRIESAKRWAAAAAGWGRRAAFLQRSAMPVTRWMLDAATLEPGQTVLELAAGPAETGLMAAEAIAPGGRLICTDVAEPMLEVARARAAELGRRNVEFRVLDAESIAIETASIDAVLCRWGYMLLADPEAALRETRRVLRPGGRVALAAWAAPTRNPWISLCARELVRRGVAEPPEPGAPGMFAFAEPGLIEALLGATGFYEVEVEELALGLEYESFGEWWEVTADLNRPLADAVATLPREGVRDLRAELERLYAPYGQPDGSLRVPGHVLAAAATA